MADIPPNQSIYVQNLYEKLPKEGKGSAHYRSDCNCAADSTTAAPGPTVVAAASSRCMMYALHHDDFEPHLFTSYQSLSART
jgi:hypothetical protein